MVYMVPHFSHFCAFCLVTLLFRMVPNCSAEVLSVFLKARGCAVPYRKNTRQFHLDMSCAISPEFSVSQPTIYIK